MDLIGIGHFDIEWLKSRKSIADIDRGIVQDRSLDTKQAGEARRAREMAQVIRADQLASGGTTGGAQSSKALESLQAQPAAEVGPLSQPTPMTQNGLHHLPSDEDLASGHLRISAHNLQGQEAVMVRSQSGHDFIVPVERSSVHGGISVSTHPVGAHWFLNNQPMGQTPGEIGQVGPGHHELRIEQPGLSAWTQIVEVGHDHYIHVVAVILPGAEALRLARQEKRRPWLGLAADPHHQDRGVRVIGVEPTSPAQKAGVKPGDILLTLDGVPVNPQRLAAIVSRHEADEAVTLTIQRDGEAEQTLTVTLGSK